MIKQSYRPIAPVNIGVNKDTVNDFARKYNLEIEQVYGILNKYKQRKVVFKADGDYWNVAEGKATLTTTHNGNIVYGVYRTADGVDTQVLAGISMDNTNVILEAEAPFDGYMLMLSDDSSKGVGSNLPEDIVDIMDGYAAIASEAADRAEYWGKEAYEKTMPDGSVTTDKLANNSITIDKLDKKLINNRSQLSAGSVNALLQIAEGYFNYAYTPDGQEGNIIYESNKGQFFPSLGTNADKGQFGMACSGFVDACLYGIPFAQSRYVIDKNIPLEWGYNANDDVEKQTGGGYGLLNSSRLAEYAYEHGFLYIPSEIDYDIKAGDIIFQTGPEDDGQDRFLHIGHVAIVLDVEKRSNIMRIMEAWGSSKYDADGTPRNVGLRVRHIAINRDDIVAGARFPIKSFDNSAKLVYSQDLNGISGSTTELDGVRAFDGNFEQGFYTVIFDGEYPEDLQVGIKYQGYDVYTDMDDCYRNNGVFERVFYAKLPFTSFNIRVNGNYKINRVVLIKGYVEQDKSVLERVLGTLLDETKAIDVIKNYILGTKYITIIPDYTDLNTLNLGIYKCPSGANATTLSNTPITNTAFRLEVKHDTMDSRLTQIITTTNVSPPVFYVRKYTSNGWQPWYKFTGVTA